MNRLLPAALFFALTTFSFFLMNALGFMLVTAVAILLLAASYAFKYRREGVGGGLAYFGLAYVGFGLALLGIGLIQTHAGCIFLAGDCYQPTLPSDWFYFKVLVHLGLTTLNGLALTFVYLNIRKAGV